ncbi:hypothetical protein T459_29153 [Capsicum annuum]|uniref:Retroviral polymerase SH3-like domain-containing protein n=1 Tax=Capsicum annuum TaxID=4072 RepID=A0A2G2Y4S5_CAPAN|nr:hypothetical protein T459_29153 [Capsicum annuum]
MSTRASVLMGYSSSQKGYLIYDMSSNIFSLSGDVSFREDIFPFKLLKNQTQSPHHIFPLEDQYLVLGDAGTSLQIPVTRSPQGVPDSVNQLEQQLQDQRRSTRGRKPPVWMNDFVSKSTKKAPHALVNHVSYDKLSSSYNSYVLKTSCVAEPRSYSKAYKNPRWVEAMKNEIEALNSIILRRLLLCLKERSLLVASTKLMEYQVIKAFPVSTKARSQRLTKPDANTRFQWDAKFGEFVFAVILGRFPCVSGESLEYLNLEFCSSLEIFPEVMGKVKPSSIEYLTQGEIHLGNMENLVALPSSICKLKCLVKLDMSYCFKVESLPEEIGNLENLEELDARQTLISRPPSFIIRLNKLKFLSFEKNKMKPCSIEYLTQGVLFVFPRVNEGLRSLEILNLSFCNLIDGGLLEDIGCLHSLEELTLSGNNFEYFPQSIAQLSALRFLGLSHCKKINFELIVGMKNLEALNLSYCNLIDRELADDIGCLSSLKELDLSGNNFEHLPQSIAQLGALRCLDLSHCKRLTRLLEFPVLLDTIEADWTNYWICNSLFQNISFVQHDISASDSLSLRVITAHLISSSDDDGVSCITRKLVLSNHSKYTLELPAQTEKQRCYFENRTGLTAYASHMFPLFATDN